jgi:hypothetical protein
MCERLLINGEQFLGIIVFAMVCIDKESWLEDLEDVFG